MFQITASQFSLITSVFSFMIAALGATTLYLVQQRREVAVRFRGAVALLSVVAGISAYTYYRLLESWNQAFTLVNGVVIPSGHAFDDTARVGSADGC